MDTTPHGYLRKVQLEYAHRALRSADPTRGDTVAGIATRWGFANAGRFATAYHSAYGASLADTRRS